MTADLDLDHAVSVDELERRLAALLASVDAADVEDLDDADEFPTELTEALNRLGVQRCYVPTRFGGLLDDYPDAGRIVRSLARTDVTLAVAHGKTFLGAVSAWVAGNDEQRQQLADLVCEGKQVSWGLTERSRGSDLLSGDVHADAIDVHGHATDARVGFGQDADGFLLHGEKWLINNATRGHAVCVLARTRDGGTARGYSLFLVEKSELGAATFGTLPKELTHGIRGADISGITFDRAYVPASALVGREGHGLEIVLKALQLTRTMCCYLSLGASDHALAITGRFVRDRVLYGRTLGDLPAARTVLVESFGAHLLAEALTTVAARSMHVLPGEQSCLAAASKYLVPSTIESTMIDLRRLMGARSLLSGIGTEGTLYKVERDHRIVSLFDGNTVVNLNTLISQFSVLLWKKHARTAEDQHNLRVSASIDAPLPALDLDRLSLIPRRGLGLLSVLAESVRELDKTLDSRDSGHAFVLDCAQELVHTVETLSEETRLLGRDPVEVPTAAFVAAEQLAACIAGSAAIQIYLNNRADMPSDALWSDALWLQLALHTALARIGIRRPLPLDSVDAGYRVLLDQLGRHSHPTLFDVPGSGNVDDGRVIA
ncbi:acyl-CoA dehydrogenase family protein [Rhodococcoides yunnanense]|jgi:alkylation response protein AidB-like acyl-CoA dehydrogenase|uniref:acyl-CoA dehydrogenase family protein n=1 Tax=Rhodococcoides yunnanense TaxID=278209 RepID=UPI0022B130E7|nr:acyl-CoA dehydrogenase family protein [Rhodococcus yunnanensis]MCZ4275369.1 acyl-CoA dehydrogenase family protein [Rhodococcus yunnanensis]